MSSLKKEFILFFLILIVTILPNSVNAHPCGVISIEFGPSLSGYVEVPLNYDKPKATKIKLYWEKFPSTQKPLKGSVFFLAGGPFPHFLYHGLKSPYFISNLFPGYDFYMYDYRGFNCSHRFQSPESLKDITPYIDMKTFAKDFVALKTALTNKNEQVLIFGGSFGGMLGSQILISDSKHIKGAILFSSDLDSDWFVGALNRLNVTLSTILPNKHKNFKAEWKNFLNQIDQEKIILFKGKSNALILTRELLEVYLWLYVSQSSKTQEAFPSMITQTLLGNLEILEKYQQGYETLKLPISEEPPPTSQSTVFHYYRCNVFFPKSHRDKLEKKPKTFGNLSTTGLVKAWNEICKPYDFLPQNPFNIKNEVTPVNVPSLFWIGDRDMFDADIAIANMKKFGPLMKARIMSGWAHDFGLNTITGIEIVRKMIHEFLEEKI